VTQRKHSLVVRLLFLIIQLLQQDMSFLQACCGCVPDVGTHVAISQVDANNCRKTGGATEPQQPELFAKWNYLKSSLGSLQQQ
jgi:hypothetical protein